MNTTSLNKLNARVRALVLALNRLPGIEVGCARNQDDGDPFGLWFDVLNFHARGLLTLSRLLSANYHGHQQYFRIKLDHKDTEPQVCFLLESTGVGDPWIKAQDLADEVNAHVDRRVKSYNILYG